jgi:hypothetical protein
MSRPFFENHIGLYAMSGSFVAAHKKELELRHFKRRNTAFA